jgi:hypothetical protein
MTLDEQFDFDLALSGGGYRLLCDSASSKFCAPAMIRGISKLYTLSNDQLLIYVGITQQPMSSRLSYGFRANGKSGYWGYKWKDLESTLRLSVWTAQLNGAYVPRRELETVEAEVAFLCRQQSGQTHRTARCGPY